MTDLQRHGQDDRLPGPPDDRFYSLDALRGLAALGVALWHWQHFFAIGTMPGPYDLERLPLLYRVFLVYTPAWQVFDLFFSLSGFVLYWIYSRPVAERTMTLGQFTWRRFSRLYPLHLLTLVIVAAGQYWMIRTQGSAFVYPNNDGPHFLAHLLFAASWGPTRGDSFNGPVWSVSVEVLLLVMFFMCCRFFPVRLRVLFVMALAGFLIVRAYNPLIGRAAGSFFLGGCMCLLYRRIIIRPSVRNTAWWVAGSAVAGLVVYVGCVVWWSSIVAAHPDADITMFSIGTIPILGHFDPWFLWVIPRVARYWSAVVVFPLMLLALALVETYRGSLGKRLAFLGDISYSVFLWHFPMQIGVVALVTRWNIDRSIYYSAWFMIAFYAAVILFSLVSYHYYEAPVKRVLRQAGFLPRSAARAEAPHPPTLS